MAFFATAPILCMDPSSLPLFEVRPQEVSSYAGHGAERKQTQAELDAIQFAKEQKSKAASAILNNEFIDNQEQERCIILAQAFEQLSGNKIRPKKIAQELPKDLQNYIAHMFVAREQRKHLKNATRFIADHTFASVPAITTSNFIRDREQEIMYALNHHENLRNAYVEHRLMILYQNLEPNNHYNEKMLLGGYILGRGPIPANSTYQNITKVEQLLGRPLAPSEVAYVIYSTGEQKIILSEWDRQALLKLSRKQLQFIESLSKKERNPQNGSLSLPLCQLKKPFTGQDEQIFKSLPLTLQANLAAYYKLDETQLKIVQKALEYDRQIQALFNNANPTKVKICVGVLCLASFLFGRYF